jgi:cation diffusion facilitator CzcD-associated flavoprotein CzcO
MHAERTTVAVIGAGPAGLGTCAALGRAGVRAVVLERADAIAAAWRGRPDCLRLNSSRAVSRVDRAPLPRTAGTFPSRDAFVAYLERLAVQRAVDVRLGTRADRVDPDEDGWVLRTSAGDLHAGHVVVATGYASEPVTPAWRGIERYQGRLLHAAGYREPGPFRGSDVLVVGAGSSGMEIAHDLAAGGAERVRLAVRTPPNVLLRLPGDQAVVALMHVPPRVADGVARLMRRLTVGDLAAHGLPAPDEGPFARTRRLGVGPSVVDRDVVRAIRAGRIEIVPEVRGVDASGVRLGDGSRIEPDTVVCATGFRPSLEPLVGHLGVLDERGLPRASGGREARPGLRFVGCRGTSGLLPTMRPETRRAAREIARRTRGQRRTAGFTSLTSVITSAGRPARLAAARIASGEDASYRQ